MNYEKMTKAELIQALKSLQSTLDADSSADELQHARAVLQVQQIELRRQNRELREAQQALHESEAYYRALIDANPLAILIYDAAGKFILCNDAMYQMLGYSDEELAVLDPTHPTDRPMEKPLWNALLSGKESTYACEKRYIHKDGHVVWAHLMAAAICDERGQPECVIFMIADITEWKLVAVQLMEASRLAAVGEVAVGVAHEILNPLTGIINCADILNMKFEGNPAHRKYLELIKSESDRVVKTVRNLLSFSRQQDEPIRFESLRDILDRALMLIGGRLNKSSINFRINVPSDLPTLMCQSGRVQQVLINLLVNALDALNARYPDADPNKILSITAAPVYHQELPYLRLTIEDHGCGIPPEQMSRIFEPFYTTKPIGQGTGLGLSISRQIVEEDGGSITVESAVGRFTRFCVDLPLERRK
jgi:PAS domain S-box-containing protein